MAESELVDVVDETDRPVRAVPRGEVHSKGLLHRCVHILLFREHEQKDLLIQQRSKNKEQSPLKWCHSASGHVLAGQSYLEGAIHELDELFHARPIPGEVAENLKKFTTFRMTDSPTNNEFVTMYTVVFDGRFDEYDRNELARAPLYRNLDKIIKEMRQDPEKYTLAFRQTLQVYTNLRHIYRVHGVLP